ncbi:MAG: DUF3945 domain-containing protein [Bacteroidota bacterium]|nr:DUF3945 domain-containing protein [Bacteroidota bacterium]
MEPTLKQDNILVLEDKQKKEFGVISSIDNAGNVKTVAPKDVNKTQFLKITDGDMLKNFMSNFLRQFNDPTRFGLYKLASDNVEKNVKELAHEQVKKEHEVKFEEFSPKRTFSPIDENRVNWSQLEALGVSREQLEKSGELKNMLEYRKTSTLIPISIQVGETTVYTEARLAFRESPEGDVNLAVHAIRKEPSLDYPFMGHRFSDEDKANLNMTGNLGRVVELESASGNKFNAYVSIDALTNELVATRSDRVNIPSEILGVKLSEQQQKELSEGKAVYVENMLSKSGKEFSAALQVNADKRGLDFRFDDSPSFAERQSQTRSDERRIPKEIRGLSLTDNQHKALTEGRTLYLKNMTDKQGQPFNAYVKYSDDENRLRFYKWNPDKSKEQTVAVAEESKTQVAVNNEGKTNEATKEIKEPLKKGQTEPTQEQKEKQEEKKAREQSKKRGRKM